TVTGAEPRPRPLEWVRPDEIHLGQPGWAEQIARPLPERSAEPVGDRDGEADLLTIDQVAWHASIQRLPQDPLPSPLADLKTLRQSPAELTQAVVEQGDARLEAYRHARPVHLGEEIVGKIAALIGEHHPLHQSEPILALLEQCIAPLQTLPA